MANSAFWDSTAVFLSWDDWGGFYDHVRPPSGTPWGPRVPGLLISPWVQSSGSIDHQNLSHDAYLKFIEDVYLGSTRLGGNDKRTVVRENAAALGDLLKEFDFNRTPMAPPSQVTSLWCNFPPSP